LYKLYNLANPREQQVLEFLARELRAPLPARSVDADWG
jgi:hypothetical protein